MAFDIPHIFLIKALTIKGHRLTSACWRFCIHILIQNPEQKHKIFAYIYCVV